MTEGDVQDYDFIRKKINDIGHDYMIKEICYDRWNSSQLVVQLIDDGANMSPFGMGYVSQSAPTKEMEKMVLKKLLVHGNNPVLRWQMQNVQLRIDPASNCKVDKKRSSEKVDGVISTIMGIGSWMLSDTKGSVYIDAYNKTEIEFQSYFDLNKYASYDSFRVSHNKRIKTNKKST